MIRKLLNRFAPITVSVLWEERIVEHKAWNRAEALEWASCYPAGTFALFLNRVGAEQGFRA